MQNIPLPKDFEHPDWSEWWMLCDKVIEQRDRLEMLEEEVKTSQVIFDSYADENQRFHDRIEALETALQQIADLRHNNITAVMIARAALDKDEGQ